MIKNLFKLPIDNTLSADESKGDDTKSPKSFKSSNIYHFTLDGTLSMSRFLETPLNVLKIIYHVNKDGDLINNEARFLSDLKCLDIKNIKAAKTMYMVGFRVMSAMDNRAQTKVSYEIY